MRKMYFLIYMTSKVYEFFEFNWNEYLFFSHFGYFSLCFLQNWIYSHPCAGTGSDL